MIHPTAVVDPEAKLGENVQIGPFSVIEAGVEIGAGCSLASHTVVREGTRLGSECRVDSFAVLGGCPNYLGFDPKTRSGLEVGDRCVIRESVTLHRSIHEDSATRIGDDCFFMASSHVAHDCVVGNRVVFANEAALAGHISMGDDSFIGGGAMVHQFSRIGEGAMISGLSRITRDVAPFILIAERDEISGLNLIGLRRRKVPAESIRELKDLFQKIIRSPGKPAEVASSLSAQSDVGQTFLAFFVPSKRGYAKSIST